MKYFLLFTLAGWFVLPLFAQHQSHEFVVHGTAIGEKAPYAYLEFRRDGKGVVDSAKIFSGHFTIRDFANEPEYAHLSFHKRGAPYDAKNEADFYVERGSMTFYGVHGDMQHARCMGSKTQDEYSAWEALRVPIAEQLTAIDNQQKLLRSLWSKGDSGSRLLFKAAWDSLDIKWHENYNKQRFVDSQFLIDHPSSALAARRLLGSGFTFESIEKIYDRFSLEIKNTWNGRQIKAALVNAQSVKIGTLAPDFSAIGINGDTVKLKDFRSKKYVLLDFWASWCGPCRDITPTVRKLHDRYGSQLEVIGISDSDTIDPWKKAIVEDHMKWVHVSGTNPILGPLRNGKSLLKLYLVNTVPSLVLISPDGMVMDKFGGGPGYKSTNLLEQSVAAHLEK